MLKRYNTKFKKMQKLRISSNSCVTFNEWSFLKWGSWVPNVCFFFKKQSLIKLKFFKKFKRKYRKRFKKKSLKFYFYCKPNFLIHEKFINSRMGKGKGSPLFWVYKPKLSKPFAIITGLSKQRCYAITRYLSKYLSPYIIIR